MLVYTDGDKDDAHKRRGSFFPSRILVRGNRRKILVTISLSVVLLLLWQIRTKPHQHNLFESRYYTHTNTLQPRTHWDYRTLAIDCDASDEQRYEDSGNRLGSGSFGKVFAALDKKTGRDVVLKRLRPTSVRKIKREVQILRRLCGLRHIVQLSDVLCTADSPEASSVLVFERINSTIPYREFYRNARTDEIRFYFYRVAMALDAAHSRGIMHRDLKPGNVGYDSVNKRVRVLDWGLSEYYIPGKGNGLGVGTKPYKPPESYFGYALYDYNYDIWAYGVMFASIIFKTYPFLTAADDKSMAIAMISLLGTEEYRAFMKKYNPSPNRRVAAALREYDGFHKATDLYTYVTSENRATAIPEAIDLLSKILRFDHNERLSAKEIMAHPYFNTVRADEAKEVYPSPICF